MIGIGKNKKKQSVQKEVSSNKKMSSNPVLNVFNRLTGQNAPESEKDSGTLADSKTDQIEQAISNISDRLDARIGPDDQTNIGQQSPNSAPTSQRNDTVDMSSPSDNAGDDTTKAHTIGKPRSDRSIAMKFHKPAFSTPTPESGIVPDFSGSTEPPDLAIHNAHEGVMPNAGTEKYQKLEKKTPVIEPVDPESFAQKIRESITEAMDARDEAQPPAETLDADMQDSEQTAQYTPEDTTAAPEVSPSLGSQDTETPSVEPQESDPIPSIPRDDLTPTEPDDPITDEPVASSPIEASADAKAFEQDFYSRISQARRLGVDEPASEKSHKYVTSTPADPAVNQAQSPPGPPAPSEGATPEVQGEPTPSLGMPLRKRIASRSSKTILPADTPKQPDPAQNQSALDRKLQDEPEENDADVTRFYESTQTTEQHSEPQDSDYSKELPATPAVASFDRDDDFSMPDIDEEELLAKIYALVQLELRQAKDEHIKINIRQMIREEIDAAMARAGSD